MILGVYCGRSNDVHVLIFRKKIQHIVVIEKSSVRDNWCDLISEIKSDKTSVRGNCCDLISEIKSEASVV